jgi:FkbM family methyltransferase
LAQHPLTVRLCGSSDLNVFSSIFILQEYSRLRSLDNISSVLDLGANVGFSSAYFLSQFPNSRVIAVEPDEQNVEICRMNLKPYGDRALVLHGAAWSECTKLCLSQDTCGVGLEWGRQVVQSSDNSTNCVEAWDVGTLIDRSGAEKVDLLKVDIERAELAVFGENAKQWLSRVRNICIELHGEDCKEILFHALANFDYGLEHYDLLTICKNIRSKH